MARRITENDLTQTSVSMAATSVYKEHRYLQGFPYDSQPALNYRRFDFKSYGRLEVACLLASTHRKLR